MLKLVEVGAVVLPIAYCVAGYFIGRAYDLRYGLRQPTPREQRKRLIRDEMARRQWATRELRALALRTSKEIDRIISK